VECLQCGATGPNGDTRSAQDDEVYPITAWQTRQPDAAVELLRRLVDPDCTFQQLGQIQMDARNYLATLGEHP
jgi:hypothetical protein